VRFTGARGATGTLFRKICPAGSELFAIRLLHRTNDTIDRCNPRYRGAFTSTGPGVFKNNGDLMMVKSLLAVCLLGAFVTAAGAIDYKDLAPCKPAAARYCDHSDTQVSMSNIMRCGATLAAISHRVGESCREVLRRYGQL
jgi:hypothetical protein